MFDLLAPRLWERHDLGHHDFAGDHVELPDSNACTGYNTSGDDVVYCVYLAPGATLSVSLLAGYDASLYLISDCADPEGTCLAGDDAFPPPLPKEFSYTHWGPDCLDLFLVVDGYDGSFGAYTFDYSLDCDHCDDFYGACCLDDGNCIFVRESECTGSFDLLVGCESACAIAVKSWDWSHVRSLYR